MSKKLILTLFLIAIVKIDVAYAQNDTDASYNPLVYCKSHEILVSDPTDSIPGRNTNYDYKIGNFDNILDRHSSILSTPGSLDTLIYGIPISSSPETPDTIKINFEDGVKEALTHISKELLSLTHINTFISTKKNCYSIGRIYKPSEGTEYLRINYPVPNGQVLMASNNQVEQIFNRYQQEVTESISGLSSRVLDESIDKLIETKLREKIDSLVSLRLEQELRKRGIKQ